VCVRRVVWWVSRTEQATWRDQHLKSGPLRQAASSHLTAELTAGWQLPLVWFCYARRHWLTLNVIFEMKIVACQSSNFVPTTNRLKMWLIAIWVKELKCRKCAQPYSRKCRFCNCISTVNIIVYRKCSKTENYACCNRQSFSHIRWSKWGNCKVYTVSAFWKMEMVYALLMKLLYW